LYAYLEKPFAFVWRDFINETSYKFAFFLQIFGIIVSALSYFFLSKLIGLSGVKYLEPYGGDYFSFVIIGIAFFGYLRVSIRSLSRSIREGQTLGTLEALLVTQTEIPTIIVSSSLYSFLWASFRVIIYIAFSVFVLGLNINNANFLGAFLILFLTIISFGSIGIISASFIMVLKRGDPITWVFTGISALLGGLYFPISVLPDWLRTFSYFLPVTYSLEGMRLAILKGYSLGELLPNILALVLFSLVMLPFSIIVFNIAVKIAKRDGSLTHY